MASTEEFDEFYLATRRRLVLQTFALTGDLGAARVAVRDAYVSAWHHWRKVSRRADPEDWVRPRAWSNAQRLHTARLLHREKKLEPQQLAVLSALGKLSLPQRRTLVLAHLAALPMAESAQELGATQARAEDLLQGATAAFAVAAGTDTVTIRAQLESLAEPARLAALPRASIIRRSGRKRRRLHALAGVVVAAAVTAAGGMFVHGIDQTSGHPGRNADPKIVTRAMLMTPATLRPLDTRQTWEQVSTSDNTGGTGIYNPCQANRFADKEGISSLVRTFRAVGSPVRTAVQTVEVSASQKAAAKTYNTTLGWYAGCHAARLQVLKSYAVSGVGDAATLLELQLPADGGLHRYSVAIARTGAITTATVTDTAGKKAPAPAGLTSTLAGAVQRLCTSKKAGTCVTTPAARPAMVPPSGEARGMLAVGDLPPVGRIDKPWVGTDPTPTATNHSATSCDGANFAKAGAARPVTRTFLIPQAKVAKRFGLSQTYGRFGDRLRAAAFVKQIGKKMAKCEDRDLASTIGTHFEKARDAGDSSFSYWRLETEVNDKSTITFWMGVIRVGPYVAQVNFAPSKGTDIKERAFRDLVVRARDRMFELP